MPAGQWLVVIGLGIAGIGVLVWAGLPLGRLPGDIVIEREHMTVYLPITTCLLLSGLLSLAGWVLRR